MRNSSRKSPTRCCPWAELILCLVSAACLAACGGGTGSGNGSPGTGPVGPTPNVTSLSQNSVNAGSPTFNLTVNGSNFVSTATVDWNGSPLGTTFVSASELHAAIAANFLTIPRQVAITVVNPGNVASNSLPFVISTLPITVVSQAANDIVWNPEQQVIYLSVPSSAGQATGNSISLLDPFGGVVGSSVFAGSEPDVLAISDDHSLLYVGLDGSAKVQRFALPTMASDISYSLGADSFDGPYFAVDLQVAPGAPRTTAVTLGAFDLIPVAVGGTAIFDDATMRATKVCSGWGNCVGGGGGRGGLFDSLQWGSDPTVLYAANNEDTGMDLYVFLVSPSGASETQDYGGVFNFFANRIHYLASTNLIYSDDGHVIDPETGLPAGVFAAQGVMVPDATLNKAFFLGQTQAQFGTSIYTIESFDLTRFTPIDSGSFVNVSGQPLRLIRWGTSGLAFNTTDGQIVLYQGSLVTEAAANINRTQYLLANPVRRSWNGRRVVSKPRHRE